MGRRERRGKVQYARERCQGKNIYKIRSLKKSLRQAYNKKQVFFLGKTGSQLQVGKKFQGKGEEVGRGSYQKTCPKVYHVRIIRNTKHHQGGGVLRGFF